MKKHNSPLIQSENKGVNDEEYFIFIDDSVDIGKGPLPVDPKLKELHESIIKKYKKKRLNGEYLKR